MPRPSSHRGAAEPAAPQPRQPRRRRVPGRQIAALVIAAAVVLVGLPAVADSPTPTVHRFVVATAGAVPSRARLARTVPGLEVRSIRTIGSELAVVAVATIAPAAQARALLERSADVVGAAPDRRFTAAGARSPVAVRDALFPDQWDLWDAASKTRAGGYGVDAPRAWTRTRGSTHVVVAVLDTGITTHPDLAGAALVPGYDFVSETDGIGTGDGDGWDADPSDPGDACADVDEPSSWHGTFVTGEIAAQHGASGVAGEAPGVTIEPVRVLGACGGTEADSIAAIEWASGGAVPGVPANAHPAAVISMSLGSGDGPCSAPLQTAVDDAVGRGALVVAAAGNDGGRVADTSPANCAGVISVAATTRSGTLAGYSNHGDSAMSPSIAAPGGSESAPIVGDTWTSTAAFAAPGDQAAIDAEAGTSMATPRVAAAVALLLSVHPGLSPTMIAARLTATATPFPAGARCTPSRCGRGIVNAGDLVGAKRVFLHATATTISGTARVGHRLSAHAGTWRPAAQHVAYRWLRDGRPIAKATGHTYRLRTRDAGHRIGLRVQVRRSDVLSAASTSAARRVRR